MSIIKDLIFEKISYEYKKPFHITNSVATHANLINVKLVLKDGVVGLGQSASSFRVNGEVIDGIINMKDAFLSEIEGMDVRNYRRVFDKIDKFSRSAPSLKAAIQYSVLDAFSQEINTPVYQILGGKKDFVETDLTISISSVEQTVKDAVEAYEAGFSTLKIKVGENLKTDIERMLGVYEATKGTKYIVDANLGYTPKEALEFSRVMYSNGVPIEIFEQPVQVEDYDGLRFVRNRSNYPVGADESIKTKFHALRLIREECVDYINIKLMKAGISDALSIVEIAKTANISLMIGCMSESGIGVAQSVHFAAGTGAFTHHDLDSFLLLKNAPPVRFRNEGNKLYPTM